MQKNESKTVHRGLTFLVLNLLGTYISERTTSEFSVFILDQTDRPESSVSSLETKRFECQTIAGVKHCISQDCGEHLIRCEAPSHMCKHTRDNL